MKDDTLNVLSWCHRRPEVWGRSRLALCATAPQPAGESVPVDALVIGVVLEGAVRPRAAGGSPEKALSGSAEKRTNESCL